MPWAAPSPGDIEIKQFPRSDRSWGDNAYRWAFKRSDGTWTRAKYDLTEALARWAYSRRP